MLGQEVDRCVFDAIGQHAAERLEWYPGLVASPVDDGRVGHRHHRLRERRQEGGLADARFASEYHAAKSRTSHQREFLGERVQLVGAADEASRVRQRARERDRDCVDQRGRVGIGIDAIPARGDAPLDTYDIRGWLGPELLDEQ